MKNPSKKANKEAPAAEAEAEAPAEATPAEERETETITADDVGEVSAKDILLEKGGGEPDERGPDDPPAVVEAPPANYGLPDDGPPDGPPEETPAEEPGIEDDKRDGAVDPETGEPRLTTEQFGAILLKPYAYSPEDVGAAIIKGLDHLALALTAEVRTRQPELYQVFQLFAAERPSILERQKRLQLRQNQS